MPASGRSSNRLSEMRRGYNGFGAGIYAAEGRRLREEDDRASAESTAAENTPAESTPARQSKSAPGRRAAKLWGLFGPERTRPAPQLKRIRARISEGSYDNLYGGIQWWRSVEQDPQGVSLTSMLPNGQHAPVLDVDLPTTVAVHPHGTLVTVTLDRNPKALVGPLEALVDLGLVAPVTLDMLAQAPPARRWLNRRRGWVGRVPIVFPFTVRAIASKTPGHHHLLVQEAMGWERAKALATRLGEAGIVDPRFARISGAGDFLYVNSTCTEFDEI